jgi:LmbE family N-acetylglucosaminyl deacetylase
MRVQLSRPEADVCVPDGGTLEAALDRTTHLAIGAHADDLEIMAWHGIRAGDADFAGVVCTDGRSAPRGGAHATLSDDALRELRRAEQRRTAEAGGYAAVLQLDHRSEGLRSGGDPAVEADLAAILAAAQPRVVYTHNPMDAHVTHVAVCVATIAAIRSLPARQRPRTLLGCEVWRGLDWLDEDATALPLEDEDAWAAAIAHYESQIEGGRPYPRGAVGRARANAVFGESHETGGETPTWLAIDLTPVIRPGGDDLESFVFGHLERFATRIGETLAVFDTD